ncbi:S1 family peptidase [Microbacterium sp.]|uniref:S1 family peptidase n=1 Tax=Microbacterium sp. TaxID=51671 RepID=UPI002D7A01ED|nr:trypsin-like serine protease [Microbacterium sp.]HET6302825.1 trypsin-like serine protease [Microbacterium sp.]
MRKPALAVAAAAAALLFMSISTPAQAVTNGVPDGDGHPAVGLMVAFQDGAPAWRCSGTLISPTLYLTAGHCTYGADHVEVWFDDDLRDAAATGYPFTGDVSGTPYTHPEYDDAAFYLHDLGMVVLDEPVDIDPQYFGTLPTLNQLDSLATKRGKQDVTFTAVGYGLQKSFPDAASWKDQAERLRMVSHPKLNQINTGFTGDGSLLLSNNAHTGGTCSGDSGGPTFIGTSLQLAGVTSFGLNVTCAGTGGVYRIDRADDLAFIGEFLN